MPIYQDTLHTHEPLPSFYKSERNKHNEEHETLRKRILRAKGKTMAENIKEELDEYGHDFPVLKTVYLILKGMRIEEQATNVEKC